jgi:hypothetical protein
MFPANLPARSAKKTIHVSFTRVIIRSLVLTALVPEDLSEAAKKRFSEERTAVAPLSSPLQSKEADLSAGLFTNYRMNIST